MKITRVDHVQIAVPPELETAAIEFYENVLGLKRLPKPAGNRLEFLARNPASHGRG